MKFNLLVIFAVAVTCCSTAFAQSNNLKNETCIPVNSKIYIAEMPEDFHTYMAAALKDVEIKLLVVTDREKADFELAGTAKPSERNSWARVIFAGQTGTKESASVTISNMKSSVVVFSAASSRDNARRGMRSVANKMARELRDKMKNDIKAGCTLPQ